MKRQQAFLASMVSKAAAGSTLFNPVRLVKFLNAGTKSLTTDPGLSKLKDLVPLVQQVRNIGLGKVQFLSLPFQAYAPDPNRLAPAPSAARMWAQVRSDRPLSREFTSDAAKASQGEPGSSTGGKKPRPTQSAEAAQNGLCA
jgi:anionic cell wall polymer biosynthesis LytR-Cps2A-Psr (LCP) family protein